MKFDVSKIKDALSDDSVILKYQKEQQIIMLMICSIQRLFDGNMDDSDVNLSEKEFFSTMNCGFCLLESFGTVYLSGGSMSMSLSEIDAISPDAKVPRILFISIIASLFFSDNEKREAFSKLNSKLDEASDGVFMFHQATNEFDLAYELYGMDSIFKSHEMKLEFEYLMNQIYSASLRIGLYS